MSTPAPELKEWKGSRVVGSNRYEYVILWADYANGGISRDGSLKLDTDDSLIPFHKLRALIDEAERVGRHYWGDEWGREK